MLRLFCDGYGGRSGTECPCDDDGDLDLLASDSIGGKVQTSPLRWNPFDVDGWKKKGKSGQAESGWDENEIKPEVVIAGESERERKPISVIKKLNYKFTRGERKIS